MRKLVAIAVPTAAAFAVGVLSACGGPPPAPPPTTSTAPAPGPTTIEPVPDPTTAGPVHTTTPPEPAPEPTPEPTTDTPVATAEVWQWALGRNVWSDPDLQPYTGSLGRTWDTDVNVQSYGFQLTPDASGVVTSVTVYNDENALGYPGSETNFRAYPGALPFDLTWSHTATDVEAMLGAGDRTGGYGTDITYSYLTTNGYRVDVGFVARHDADLAGSPMHFIRVSLA